MSTDSKAKHTLPPVAKSFYTFCKKCDADRYHKVLAHTAANTAKIECEVCHSKKAYKVTPAKKVVKGAVEAPKTARGTAAKAAALSKSLARHEEQYQATLASLENQSPVDYKMSVNFKANQKVTHPKFGLGVVINSFPEKVEVIFKDEVRNLVHNRT